jgi:error-prone DNA polymerase
MARVVAGFSGGEAEELRRAMGFKRSEKRMHEIEAKLRAGMKRNGISREAQEQIVLSITSFALYGFPESHAASFALLAYASAYLKCHYIAAFTAALLNNQPMGFYSPATLVKDAQRHGLKVLPVDVMKSEWECTLEDVRKHIALRLGLRYVRGLHEEAGRAIAREQNLAPFTSIHDVVRRVPELRRDELNTLAEIGALNSVRPSPQRRRGTEKSGSIKHPSEHEDSASSVPLSLRGEKPFHRRDALWNVGAAANPAGPLLENIPAPDNQSPLKEMTSEERLVADFRGTGMTVGPHPMAYHRPRLDKLGVRRASDLGQLPGGRKIRTAGCVIARQRPGTAKGFLFLSLEDETGVANAIVTPDLFQQNRLLLTSEQFLMIEGILQNQDGVVSVKAARVSSLSITQAPTHSHDFH